MDHRTRRGRLGAVGRLLLANVTLCGCSGAATAYERQSLERDPWSDEWAPHTIADFAHGSDGVAIADFDGDDRLDVAGAWEADGLISVHFHPGDEGHGRQWPAARVRDLDIAEGVVAGDLDGDGTPDLVGLPQAEGERGGIRVLLTRDGAQRWDETVLPGSEVSSRWLTAAIGDLDGDGDDDIVAGPATSAVYAWLAPDWFPVELGQARHVMRVRVTDMDDDGDADVVLSQRYEVPGLTPPASLHYLEAPSWTVRELGRGSALIACFGDVDGDGDEDIVQPYGPYGVRWYERGAEWAEHEVVLPPEIATTEPKGCAIGDLDGDGDADLALTTAGGLQWVWIARLPEWSWRSIDPAPEAPVGTWAGKLEEPALADIDADGALDVIVSEENRGRGLVWFRNPGGAP